VSVLVDNLIDALLPGSSAVLWEGLPAQLRAHKWRLGPDPWIWDDQAVVVNLKGKGLVVLSGCSHSGAINVPRQARRLTGEDRVHAFLGGMHLTGGIFERLIPRTLDELAAISPRRLAPGHCSWKATHEVYSVVAIMLTTCCRWAE
jgi:7,8-dihydropterin-6-yl-methyl-4-(beta-D-ribofuranosyl)aminobenzene 5'-phosphate synthase